MKYLHLHDHCTMARLIIVVLTFASLLSCTKRDNSNESPAEQEYTEAESGDQPIEVDVETDVTVAFQRSEAIFIKQGGNGEKRITKGTDPSISPDGTRLAYTRSTGSGDDYAREIYIIDLQTGREEKLDVPGDNYYGPVWSPDGAHIAFNYFTGTNWEIGIVNSDNTGFRITQGNDEFGMFSPTWHPDGQSIVAHNLSDIIEFDLNGESIRGVNTEKIISAEFSISSSTRFWITADRQYLFFNAEVDEYRDDLEGPLEVIAYCNLDTNENGRISPEGLYATDLYVTPELELFFDGFKENQEFSDIYQYDFKTRELDIVVGNGTGPSSTQ